MMKPGLHTKSIGFKVREEEEYVQLDAAKQGSLGELCTALLLFQTSREPSLLQVSGRLLQGNDPGCPQTADSRTAKLSRRREPLWRKEAGLQTADKKSQWQGEAVGSRRAWR